MNNIGELDIKEIININNITTSDIVKMNKEQITFVQQQLIDLGANLGKLVLIKTVLMEIGDIYLWLLLVIISKAKT